MVLFAGSDREGRSAPPSSRGGARPPPFLIFSRTHTGCPGRGSDKTGPSQPVFRPELTNLVQDL